MQGFLAGAGHKVFSHAVPFPVDSTETPKPKSSPEHPPGQGRTRAGMQVRALGPEDDLAGMFLQVLTPLCMVLHMQVLAASFSDMYVCPHPTRASHMHVPSTFTLR